MKLVFLTLMVSLFLIAGSTFAQVDQGEPDSLIFEMIVAPDATTNQLQLAIQVSGYNDVNKLIGLSCGFGWDNSNLQMDSASRPYPESYAMFDQVFLFDGSNINTTNANQRFLFSGFTFGSKGVDPSPTRKLLATYYFTLSQWNANDEIIIDILEYDDGTRLQFIDYTSQETYRPLSSEQIVVHDTARSVPSNLLVSETLLEYFAVEGQAAPASQTFDINSDNDQITFSLSEDAAWLLKSPSVATTPSTISVSINNYGLTAGFYEETILIESSTAENSPQQVVVQLTIEAPPAVIQVSQTNFLFNSVVDGANPSSQIFDITNSGGQDLIWSATGSESWLDVSPGSGINDATVTLSPDITGLAIGVYYDTVLVSDPAATNSPVRVVVQLSVASGLPEISVVESSNMIVVDLPPDNPDTLETGPPALDITPVTIEILNIGGGLMNFTLQETSTKIINLTPSAGEAPAQVLVEFNIFSNLDEGDYYDTLWVHSDEATNSPYPVEFHFYAKPHPAQIFCTKSVVVLEVHECLAGTRRVPESVSFSMLNTGGDHPMVAHMIYDTDMFRMNTTIATAPATLRVIPLDAGLPVGTYYDTIFVTVPAAVNNPHIIEVQYVVLPASESPEIDVILNSNGIEVSAQEDSGPFPVEGFEIYNLNFGCMAWYFDHNVPWATPNISSGNVMSEINFVINPAGLTLGTYTDTILIIAPDALVSQKLPMTIHIWRLRGDMDQNALINLADITALIMYVYLDGTPPWPTLEVGDVNCDGIIDLADITLLIAYVYEDGPRPCGNPYVSGDGDGEDDTANIEQDNTVH